MFRFLRLFLLALCAGGALAQCRRVGEQAIYLLPNRFVGNVLVVYGQPGGAPAEYRNGARLYRIPANGVLRTRFAPNYGLHQPDQYFYVDKSGKTIKKLIYLNTASETSHLNQPTDTICYHETPFKDSKTIPVNYTILSVSNIIQADSIYEARNPIIQKL